MIPNLTKSQHDKSHKNVVENDLGREVRNLWKWKQVLNILAVIVHPVYYMTFPIGVYIIYCQHSLLTVQHLYQWREDLNMLSTVDVIPGTLHNYLDKS